MLALTHIRDRIAEIVFHHPSHHAFDSMIWESLRAGRNPDVNGVVVGAERRVFCGGAATYRPPKPIALALSRLQARYVHARG